MMPLSVTLFVVFINQPDWSYYRQWPSEIPLEIAIALTIPREEIFESKRFSFDWWDYLLRCHYCTEREYHEAFRLHGMREDYWKQLRWVRSRMGTPKARYLRYWNFIRGVN